MSELTITESEMTFGPFHPDACFAVEASVACQSIQSNTKIAEFMWLRTTKKGTQVWIVEAKSSSPRPAPPERFSEFVLELRDKMVNSLAMLMAACLRRPGSAHGELPAAFVSADLSTIQPVFVLVVRGHKTERLPHLQEALQRAPLPTMKTWAISTPAVTVLNDTLAHQYQLIQ